MNLKKIILSPQLSTIINTMNKKHTVSINAPRLIFIALFLFCGLGTLLFLPQSFAKEAHSHSPTTPDIGVNALVTGTAGNMGNLPSSTAPNGFRLQEIEARFSSDVDDYFHADISLTIEESSGTYSIEPEEAFIESISLKPITLRVGKYHLIFTKHNPLHTHDFPFIDAPLPHQSIFGTEGFNEIGVAVSYLAPVPWDLTVSAQGVSAQNTMLFNSNTQDDIAGVFSVDNEFQLNDVSTFDLNFGFAQGSNAFRSSTQVFNVSLGFNWDPDENADDESFSWVAEFLQSYRKFSPTDERVGGVSTWIQWQFQQIWWLQGRAEYLGLPSPDAGNTKKFSFLIGVTPSDFSAIRLQYDAILVAANPSDEHRVTLQLMASIGSHSEHDH